jgi:hypothetical protein
MSKLVIKENQQWLKKLDDAEQELWQCISGAAEQLVRAAEIVRSKMSVDPEWADKFSEKCPLYTTAFLRRLSLVGVKTAPQLFLLCSAGADALRRLPMPIQEQYASAPVDLLCANGEVLKADINVLLPNQTRQVFASDHVRSLEEQKAWIESQKTKAVTTAKRADVPYRVVKGDLVTDNVKISLSEIIKAFGKETVLTAVAKL